MLKTLASLSVMLALSTYSGTVFSHGGEHADGLGWLLDGWLTLLMVLSVIAYVAGCRQMHRDQCLTQVLGHYGLPAFMAGMFSLVVALLSPLDRLADEYFSVHMTQHLILMIIAPPLLVLGRPVIVWLWAFPLEKRRIIGKWWNRSAILRPCYEWLMQPAMVWILASVALWLWHIPALYQWAIADELIHAIEHTCFFLTSLAFWTLSLPQHAARGQYGVAIVAVITFVLHSAFLGALLTFAAVPFYQPQAHVYDTLTPLEDQQLAGLIMWIPANLVYLITLSWLFLRWLENAHEGKPYGISVHK